jgi:hypothetical protein
MSTARLVEALDTTRLKRSRREDQNETPAGKRRRLDTTSEATSLETQNEPLKDISTQTILLSPQPAPYSPKAPWAPFRVPHQARSHELRNSSVKRHLGALFDSMPAPERKQTEAGDERFALQILK